MRFLRRAGLAGVLASLGTLFCVPLAWAGAPAQTKAATSITDTSAVLNGQHNCGSNGSSSSYDYGTTIAYGTNVVATAVSASNTDDPKLISGLTPGTTYHFRYRGNTACIGGLGADMSFTTTTSGGGGGGGDTDLSVRAQSTIPGTVHVGETTVITFVITNRSDAQATGVTLSSTLPAGVSVVAFGGTCSGTFTCSIGSLNANATATITVTLRALVSGMISFTAAVSSATNDPISSNDTANAFFGADPAAVTRTLTLSSETRVAGQGGQYDSFVRVTGTLTSSNDDCVAFNKISVRQSNTANDANAPETQTFSVSGDGTFTASLQDFAGQYWTLVVAARDFNPACLGASASFTLAPRTVGRTLTAAAARSTSSPHQVGVTGQLTANDSPYWCGFNQTVVISNPATKAQVTAVRTDGQGKFGVILTDPPTDLAFSIAQNTSGANICGAANAKASFSGIPLRRILVGTATSRIGPNAFTIAGQVSAIGNQAECQSGAIVGLDNRASDSADWKRIGKSGPTDAKGNYSIKVTNDDGQFRVALDQVDVGPYGCAADTAPVRVPTKPVKQSITATSERVAGNLAVINVTGAIDSNGVKTCNPDFLLVVNRNAGSKDDWKFIGWVKVVDNDGDFTGYLNAPGGAGLEWQIVVYDQTAGQYQCSGAVAPLAVKPQPDQRKVKFTTKQVSSFSAPAEVSGFLTANTISCASQAKMTIDGFAGGRDGVLTGNAVAFTSTLVRSSFTKGGALNLAYPNVPWRVSVPTETVEGVVCGGMTIDTPAFTAPAVTNLEGEIAVTGNLAAFSTRCQEAVGVALESLQPKGWETITNATTNKDGSFSFKALDPGNAYDANAWRVSADDAGFDDGTCADASRTFTMPHPTLRPPPPPLPAVNVYVAATTTKDGTDGIVKFQALTDSPTAMRDCAAGRVLWIRLNNNFTIIDNSVTLDANGVGQITYPLQRGAQLITFGIAAKKGHQPCNAFNDGASVIPGYGPPATQSFDFKDVAVSTGGWSGDAGGNQIDVTGRLTGPSQCTVAVPLTVFRKVNGLSSSINAVFPQSLTGGTTTDANGTFDVTFTDPGGNYGPNDWEIRATPPADRGTLTTACQREARASFSVAAPKVHPTESVKISSVSIGALPGVYGGSVTVSVSIASSPAGSACASGLVARADTLDFQDVVETASYKDFNALEATYYGRMQLSPRQHYDFATLGSDGKASLMLPQGNVDTKVQVTVSPSAKNYPAYCGKVTPITVTMGGAGTYERWDLRPHI